MSSELPGELLSWYALRNVPRQTGNKSSPHSVPAGYPIGSITHRVLTQALANVCVTRSLEPAP